MPYPSQIQPEEIGPRALRVVEEKGWQGWSLREVAGALGVTPNALYRYVEDRDDLVVSIGAAAAAELGEELAAARGAGRARLVDLARRYVRFAVDRPHAFSAFAHAKPAPDHPKIEAWFTLWEAVYADFVELVPRSAEAAAFAFWALVHGRAELARGPAMLAGPTAGLEDAVAALLDGFERMGRVPSPLPPHVPVRR